MLDIFNDDAWSVVRLTARVNDAPFMPGQVGRLGVFDTNGVDTLQVGVEKMGNSVGMVAYSPRGGPGETIAHDRANMRIIPIPHMQRDDALYADEVQGRRTFGSETELETVQSRFDAKMARHLRDFDTTIEHQRVGALKGIVIDKFGATVLNIFSAFEIDPPTSFKFDLDNDAIFVRDKSLDVILAMEDSIDVPYTGIHALCGATFWRKLINHKSVRETYLNTAQAAELRGIPPDTFELAGITWERYRTGRQVTAANAATPFIATTEARFILKGVPELYITRFGPADYLETVNTIGLPRYAKQFPMPNGKGIALEVQSNPISLITRPEAVQYAVVAGS